MAYWGFQNPWRIRELGDKLVQLDLKKVISDPETPTRFSLLEQEESSLRMASVFLWEQGRFKHFLKLIAAHDKAGYRTYFEAAMEMPIEKIRPLWENYPNDVAAQRTKIMRLPISRIFGDDAAFQSFVKANDISLRQPKTHD